MLDKIVNDTVATLGDNKLTLLKVTIVPIILMFGLEAISASIGITEVYQVILYQAADSIIWAIFAISIHRIILLGDSSVGPLGNIRLKSREIMYIAFGFLIAFVIGFMWMVLSFIPILGFIAGIVLAVIIWSRLSIMLPAIAVDNTIGVKRVWDLTDGYTLTCIGSVLILPVIIAIPLYFQTGTMLSNIVSVIYGFIVMAVTVALLSNTYKNLVNTGIPRDEEEFGP